MQAIAVLHATRFVLGRQLWSPVQEHHYNVKIGAGTKEAAHKQYAPFIDAVTAALLSGNVAQARCGRLLGSLDRLVRQFLHSFSIAYVGGQAMSILGGVASCMAAELAILGECLQLPAC